MKGLIADIMVSADGVNYSNGGISKTHKRVIVVGLGAGAEVFSVNSESPAVRLVFRDIAGQRIVHAEPACGADRGNCGWMFGGSYIASCDSRFAEFLQANGVTGYIAVPLHDRQEPAELARALSV